MYFSIFAIVLLSFGLASAKHESRNPSFVFNGEPKVVARKIIMGSHMKITPNSIESDDNQDLYHVNLVDSDIPIYRTGHQKPVSVYRRMLKPARLAFRGKEITSEKWIISNDKPETDKLNLNRRPIENTSGLLHFGGNT